MRSNGFSRSQGGADSAFQHRRNAVPPTQDINFTPVPVAHSESELQNNMVVTQYPRELRVAYGLAQLHQGCGQSQQQQGLHHRAESQATEVSTGFHHPIPEDSACTSRNSRHQISREVNADFHSSAHVSAQHSSCFGTSASENSISINSCKQQRSNLKNTTGLKQRRHLNRASLTCTSSPALQGVAARTFPLQDRCSSHSLLCALLQGSPSDSKSFTTVPSLSEETNGNIELNTIPHFSDERHHKGQQVKGSQAALNCRGIRTQNVDHSGGTPSIPHQQQDSSLQSLSSQPFTDKVLPVGKSEPPTDAEIYDYIKQKCAYFMSVLTQKGRNSGHNVWDRNSTLHSDYTIPDSVAHLPTTSASDKDVERQSLNCPIIEECTAAVEEDRSKDSKASTELTPKFKAPKREFVKKSASLDLDFSVKKNLDTTMPANRHCKLSADCDQSFELASLIENQDSNTKKRKNDKLCSVTCKEAIAHSELNIQAHNAVSIPANQSERLSNQRSGEGVREDAGSVHSQTDLCIALYENKDQEHATQTESKGEEARPQYEDISDDDTSKLATTLPNREREKLSIPACIKDPQYEDISDSDSAQIEHRTVEVSQIPEPNDEQSPFENEGHEHLQGWAQMKTEIIPDEDMIPKQQISPKTLEMAQQCSCPCFVETDYGFEDPSCPKCNHETQTNHSLSNSPSSVLKGEDETDDEMVYDCFLLSVIDLKYEPEDEDQDSPGKNVLEGGETENEERHCDTSPTPPKAVSAFDFPQLPVYDTKESFIQAMRCRFEVASGKSTPEHGIVSEGGQNRTQSVDSCETEDSCDYSSASEQNYLTVSRKMLKKRSATRPSETDVSESEKVGEGDEVANTQKGQTRSINKSGCMQKLKRLIEATASCSKQLALDDVIVIVSDTEDEIDYYLKKKAKRKRKEIRIIFSSDSEDSGDAPCSQQKRHSPVTVGRQCGTVKETRLPSADSPAPQHRSNHDTPTEEVLQNGSSYLSHSTGKSGQLIKTKAASEYAEGVMSVDSNREDDSDQKYKKPSRKRFFSSESDSGDVLCVEPETRLSSTDSSRPQRQSKLHDTQLKDMMPDACSDLSHNRKKSGKLIEAKSGSVHVRHKTNRQVASKKRVVFHDSVVKKGHFSKKMADKKGISSGSGDSSDDLFATKDRPSTDAVDRLCGDANKRPQKNRLSCEDSPEQQPPSVDKEVDSTGGPTRVIPRFIVKPSPSMILLEEPTVHRQGKARTLSPQKSTAFSKKTASRENSHENLRMDSRRFSLDRPVSEARLSSVSSRGLSPSGETSASPTLSASKESTSIPKQYLPISKLQRSHSYGSPSTSSSAPMPLSAKKQLSKDWKDSFFPTKRDKKYSMRMEEDIRVANDSLKEARPGPSHHDKTSRRRHKSVPPLLKKTKNFAIQRTKDINRDAPKERCPVGEGYKWANPTKGSSREGKKCRSPPSPHW